MISFRESNSGKQRIYFYKRKSYKKARWKRMARRTDRWYERKFGVYPKSSMVQIRKH